METTAETVQGMSKINRYGWTLKDEAGVFRFISKHQLQIHPSYQRHAIDEKVRMIASAWSWVACGAIVVGDRGGEFWVIDGQHRVLASRRRSDIEKLPCLVFTTGSTKQEAQGFLNLNVGRKPVYSLDKFRALIVAGDEVAIYVDSVFKKFGITPKATSSGPLSIKCVGSAMNIASANREVFEDVMSMIAVLCKDIPIPERTMMGLAYLRTAWGEFNKKVYNRIIHVGAQRLYDGQVRASAYFKRGGSKVWAQGMLDEINKGLQNKYVLEEE